MSEGADDRARTAREHLAKLRALLARGATLREAADQITELAGQPLRAYRLAVKHNMRRRRRAITPAQQRTIDKELRKYRLTLRKIAARAKVALHTVQRRKAKLDGPGPRPCRRRRCPRGHLVVLWPCQLCRAIDGDLDPGEKAGHPP